MKPDWTEDELGRSNNSPEFHRLVEGVADILRSHRLCDDVADTARVIIAKLAHFYGLEPRR